MQREKEREEAEHKQEDWEKMKPQEHSRKREASEVLMDPRLRKAADRLWLEREGDEIMEAEEKHEEKEKQLEEEKRVKDEWEKWEDRQRLSRGGDEIVEAIRRHERREEEMERAEEEVAENCGNWGVEMSATT